MGRSKDVISEQEFNQQVASKKSLDLPENDSPGDSEFDAGEEFEIGVEFTPEAALLDDTEYRISRKKQRITEEEIPASARVVSSELPSPWLDNENSSSTN
jgi:hypothetical protein